MAYTGKQERNGATGSGGEQNSAQPGPDSTAAIAGLLSQSQSAAENRGGDAKNLFVSPAGSGVGGHDVGAVGPMFEWDSGLAIAEQPGEA